MDPVEQLEAAIAHLSAGDLARFLAWFLAFDAQAWDEQIAADAASGKLDHLAQQALESHRRGECSAC